MKKICSNNEDIRLDFLADITQELSTPLSITREGLNLLLEKIEDKITDHEQKILLTAQGNIERLSQSLKNLLELSRIEAGKLDFKRKKLNFLEFLKEVQSSWEPKVMSRGLQWKTTVPLKEILVYANAERLHQVFHQLLDNALRFTKRGCIDITIKELEKAVECSIVDTGEGIAPEHLPKLFKKFCSFGSPNGAVRGLGLGLAFTKAIVNLHQGKIFVKSTLGEGTTVVFTLPQYTGKGISS